MLSNCVGHLKTIRHRVDRPNRPTCCWYAHLSEDKIIYSYETNEDVFETIAFKTLDDFVLDHYNSNGIVPIQFDAWKECETCIYGTWKPLEDMRDSLLRTREVVERRAKITGDLL
jgi:hypothetical protein